MDESIGVPYELIKIDNAIEKLSIVKAYNIAAKKATNELLVFVHEDVIFHTMGWGKRLLTHFENLNNPGVLGLAGSGYLPISPTDWWIGDSKYRYFNYLERVFIEGIHKTEHRFSGHTNPTSAFLLDGMFLALKKEVFEVNSFDERVAGFHGYDVSICLRSASQFQNYFIPDILIEHLSRGKPNSLWIENLVKSYSQVERSNYSCFLDFQLEKQSFHLFLNQLMKLAPNRWFQINQSFKFLVKLQNEVFSPHAVLIWFWFQIRFLLTLR